MQEIHNKVFLESLYFWVDYASCILSLGTTSIVDMSKDFMK